MTPFWYRWPSWLTELVAGGALQTLAFLAVSSWEVIPAAALASVIYEQWIDVHGWSTSDVLQRAVGQAAVVAVWVVVR